MTKPKKTDYLDFEISFLEKIVKEKPDYVDALTVLAESYTRRGEYVKGLQIDKQLEKLCPRDATVSYNLACSYALTGKKELALKTLSKAVRLGYNDFEYLKKDTDLRSLREEPAFKSLCRKKSKNIRHDS